MKSPLLSRLKAGVALTAIVAQLAVAAGPASAFCGFYVAQADAKLFKQIVPRSFSRATASRPRSPWRATTRANQ